MSNNEALLQELIKASQGRFPGFLGMEVIRVGREQVLLSMPVRPEFLAPNGYLHAGSVVSLADTACGFGCRAHLAEDATGFTTIELKSNHVSTARDGTLECLATPAHIGRSTHVWDAVVEHADTGRRVALFRCTQMILYARPVQASR